MSAMTRYWAPFAKYWRGFARVMPWTWLRRIAIALGILAFLMLAALWLWVQAVTRDLPDVKALAGYQPEITTRVHAGDGKLIAEFASENRIFVPYDGMPEHLIAAFVSAEDKTFFDHGGLDYFGIMRAAIRNAMAKIQGGGGLQGASTITQQVAKNMLLTNDQNIERKVREAVVARRMERAFSKEKILELYLNEIYLGGSSYGVASAALNYFNKSLPDLTLSEAALLAAMPKAPSRVNPYVRPDAAVDRRNWVLRRMQSNGYIDRATADAAIAEPLEIRSRLKGEEFAASAYFVEELRRDLAGRFGEEALYQQGLSIRSTIDTRLQLAAQAALQDGLVAYDRRHGYRGPVTNLKLGEGLLQRLNDVELPGGYGANEAAVVLEVENETANLLLTDGSTVPLAPADLSWASKTYRSKDERRGLKVGDVILASITREAADTSVTGETAASPEVEVTSETQKKEGNRAQPAQDAEPVRKPVGNAKLFQVPDVEGALLAIDPHTGRVLAMAGGYSFWKSQFNRTTQAKRQPGSAFKPFVYGAALETINPKTGTYYTPSTRILDAPVVDCDYTRVRDQCYRPTNYTSGRFYGLSTMRLGLELSRNAMTVRLAQEIGMEPIIDLSRRVGLFENLAPYLSMSLGAGEVTVWDMARAYGVMVNGGKEIQPTLFDRVQDRNGVTLYRHDERACEGCSAEWSGQQPPVLADIRKQVVDPVTAYQVVHMLEGVVERGTATVVKRTVEGHPLAGKTGTTNDYMDAWFMGFSPDLVVGVFVGFDEPKSLGEGEAGGVVAAPIFANFMKEALKGKPSIPFRAPAGVRLVEVDAKTGALPGSSTSVTILEAFKPGTEPGFGGVFQTDDSFGIFGSGDVGDDPALANPELASIFGSSDPDEVKPGLRVPQPEATIEQDVGLGDSY